MVPAFVSTLLPILAFVAEEGGEGGHEAAVQVGNGGALAQWAWLIVVVPLVVPFLIVFFGKKLPFKGWELAVGTMGFIGAYGTALLLANASSPIATEFTLEVGRIGSFAIEWGWVVDGLSIMMYFLVGVVGFFVFVYAKGYMEGDIRFTWFFAAFTLFAGGMLVLVSAPNLIQLIVGWEMVGLASYLLIGHYWEDYANVDAGNKAFMTNKVADAALFIGAIIMALSVGSFSFADMLAVVTAQDASSPLATFGFWAGLMLFIGAMGKSAQFPFHVWLPDAMAGPTPVSALMHAATMVTAGVYLLGRVFPFYLDPAGLFGGQVRVIIMVIGGITLLFMGLLAFVQDDIKKVLAYSTVSQLGYMVAAMGAGAYTAGLFHCSPTRSSSRCCSWVPGRSSTPSTPTTCPTWAGCASGCRTPTRPSSSAPWPSSACSPSPASGPRTRSSPPSTRWGSREAAPAGSSSRSPSPARSSPPSTWVAPCSSPSSASTRATPSPTSRPG